MAPFRESLGSAYFKMGELDKAIEEFEKIQSLTIGRLYYGDIYAKSYYNLGRIFEQKGWVGKAIESYGRFLDLWRDADPGLPEVDDALQRLAAIK
jgi:tetratricopeptide (TPR) repeat protein